MPDKDYGTHEALDRTYMITEMMDLLVGHPQILENPEWLHLAERALQNLLDLYQSIGQKHL